MHQIDELADAHNFSRQDTFVRGDGAAIVLLQQPPKALRGLYIEIETEPEHRAGGAEDTTWLKDLGLREGSYAYNDRIMSSVGLSNGKVRIG